MLKQINGDKEIPNDNAIKGNFVKNTTIVDKEQIEKIYRSAFKVAESGDQGKGLPSPMSRCVEQKKKRIHTYYVSFKIQKIRPIT
jgi:hypothetical protein